MVAIHVGDCWLYATQLHLVVLVNPRSHSCLIPPQWERVFHEGHVVL